MQRSYRYVPKTAARNDLDASTAHTSRGEVMHEREFESAALDRLSRDFPDVPLQVIVRVLVRYLSATTSLTDALRATHDRITQPCAV
jgi:hypothetical protein